MSSTDNGGFVRFIISMMIFISILIIIGVGSYHALDSKFENEYLKFGVIIVASICEAVGVHVVTNAVRNRVVLGEKFIISNSFGLHSCNADETHCFWINSKPLPICARHLGLYASLFSLGIIILLTYESWFEFGKVVSWNVHLAIFFILLAIVVVEGGLGKAEVIKQRNSLRCLGGVLTTFGWLFFAMFFGSFFNLFP